MVIQLVSPLPFLNLNFTHDRFKRRKRTNGRVVEKEGRAKEGDNVRYRKRKKGEERMEPSTHARTSYFYQVCHALPFISNRYTVNGTGNRRYESQRLDPVEPTLNPRPTTSHETGLANSRLNRSENDIASSLAATTNHVYERSIAAVSEGYLNMIGNGRLKKHISTQEYATPDVGYITMSRIYSHEDLITSGEYVDMNSAV